MEIQLQKLMGQLGVIFLVIWVVAAALGQKSEMAVGTPQPRNKNGGSNMWRGRYSRFGALRFWANHGEQVAQAPDASSVAAGSWVL